MKALRTLLRRVETSVPTGSNASFGPDARFDGEPTVITQQGGRMEVGARFSLSSLPVQSHLVSLGMLSIGNDVSIAHGAAVAAFMSVTIGDRVRIGPFFIVMDTDFHGERAQSGAKPTTRTAVGEGSGFAPVTIGADVRIGANVTVLRGSVIGDGATIAAGSVVNGRIPGGALASGVPARVVDQSATTTSSIDFEEPDAASVIAKVFGLLAPPDPGSGPDDVPEWDSLGSLKLLLALEEAFGCTIDEDVLAAARTVGDVQRVVELTRQRAAARA